MLSVAPGPLPSTVRANLSAMSDDVTADKALQLDADLTQDDRTEISDELKDALWADARTVEQHAADLAALNNLSSDELEQAKLHHQHMVDLGIRAH